MQEKAFIVKRDSDLGKKYIASHREEQKSHELARAFFKKHNLMGEKHGYIFRSVLTIEMDENLYNTHKKDLKKAMYNACYAFKVNSELNKLWLYEVYNKIDHKAIDDFEYWYFGCASGGSYAMWEFEGVIYGFLSSKYDGEITLPNGTEEIKLSQYYLAAEAWNEAHKKL